MGTKLDSELTESINVFFDDSYYPLIEPEPSYVGDGNYYEMQADIHYMLVNNLERAENELISGINFAHPDGYVEFTDGPNQASGVNRYYNNNNDDDYYDDYDVRVEAADPYHLVDPHHIKETEPERERDLLYSKDNIYEPPRTTYMNHLLLGPIV